MKIIQYLFSTEIIEALGWTLVHSIWQGALVALLVSIILILMHKNSAQVRYFISYMALIGLLLWSTTTFIHSYQYAKQKTELKEKIITTPGAIRNIIKQNYLDDKKVIETDKHIFNLQLIKTRSFFQRHFNWICSFWAIGMIIFMFRLIGGFIYLKRIRSSNLIPFENEWLEKLYELIDRLKINRKIRAYFSPYIRTPLTLGAIKPVLLFPVSVFTGFSSKEIEAILAHELAHVLRNDYFFNIIQSIIEIIFFYNPAIWIVSSHIRNERENSCDNIAVGLTGDKIAFAKALAGIQLYQVEQERLAMAFSSSRGGVLNRIKRLQERMTMKTNLTEGLIAAGIIILSLTLASFTFSDNALAQVKSGHKNAQTMNQIDTVKSNKNKAITNNEVDSILEITQKHLEKKEELQSTEELKELLEVALSENDKLESAEMLDNINDVMVEVDVENITKDAMRIAADALDEANRELKDEENPDNIKEELEQASEELSQAKKDLKTSNLECKHHDEAEEFAEESAELGLEAARFGINIATEVIENIPVQEIIESSLIGVSEALKAIDETDFDSVYEEHKLTKEEMQEIKSQMKKTKKELEKQMKELERQMDELDEQMSEE